MAGETFLAKWRVLCLMDCPNGTTYNAGTCELPSSNITNCSTSANATHCAACDPGYFLADNEAACIGCMSATFGVCETCTNKTVCQTCAIGFVLTGSFCYSCSFLIGNCLLCNSATDCTECIDDSYLLLSPIACRTCNFSLPLCLRCDSLGCL